MFDSTFSSYQVGTNRLSSLIKNLLTFAIVSKVAMKAASIRMVNIVACYPPTILPVNFSYAPS